MEAEQAQCIEDKAHLAAQVDALKDKNVLPQVQELTSVWLRRKPTIEERDVVFLDDPVYGQYQVDERLLPIFFHPLLQRLNYIRQLSFAYLIFPSASHTRLSHTLGVARNAQAAMRAMFERNWLYTGQGRESIPLGIKERDRLSLKAQLCGLLHDVGHGPFGHALDTLIPYLDVPVRSEVPDKLFSMKYVVEYLEEEIRQVGFTVDNILCILDKEKRIELQEYDVLIPDIIDSAGDVDRMDYLVRDAHMTGLGVGYSKPEALIEHMCPFRGKGCSVNVTFEESALPHLENLLYARDIMYINCYEHPRKVCAERLLVRLAEYLLQKGVKREQLMLLTDGQLLAMLSQLVPGGTAEDECLRGLHENCSFHVERKYNLSRLVSREDSGQQGAGHALEENSSAPRETAFNKELSKGVEEWYELRPKKSQRKFVFVDQPKTWEQRICAEAGLDKSERWKVVVTVPAYEAKQERESAVRLLCKTKTGYACKELFEASDVMKAVVTNLIPSREVIRVLVSQELRESDARKVGEAADAVFKR